MNKITTIVNQSFRMPANDIIPFILIYNTPPSCGIFKKTTLGFVNLNTLSIQNG